MGLQEDLKQAREESNYQPQEEATEAGVLSDAAAVVESGLNALEATATQTAALFAAPAVTVEGVAMPTVDLTLPAGAQK